MAKTSAGHKNQQNQRPYTHRPALVPVPLVLVYRGIQIRCIMDNPPQLRNNYSLSGLIVFIILIVSVFRY